MGIECPICFDKLNDRQFEQIDREVMGRAFDVHNSRGRLFDEQIYENDLASRLVTSGFDATTQVPVTASWAGIEKTWRLDLVVNHMVYELKSVSALLAKHEAQALAYAALLRIDRIKLLNFGANKVAGKLLRTPFCKIDRFDMQFHQSQFCTHGSSCSMFLDTVRSLVNEIGGFLEASVYGEFLSRYFDRQQPCNRRVPVSDGDTVLGSHLVSFYDQDSAFYVSAHRSELSVRQAEIQRMINVLPAPIWQWVNVAGTDVTIITLTKQNLK